MFVDNLMYDLCSNNFFNVPNPNTKDNYEDTIRIDKWDYDAKSTFVAVYLTVWGFPDSPNVKSSAGFTYNAERVAHTIAGAYAFKEPASLMGGLWK